MSDPLSQVNEADLAAQEQSVDPSGEDAVSRTAWAAELARGDEANIADVIEQQRNVPLDDDYDR